MSKWKMGICLACLTVDRSANYDGRDLVYVDEMHRNHFHFNFIDEYKQAGLLSMMIHLCISAF